MLHCGSGSVVELKDNPEDSDARFLALIMHFRKLMMWNQHHHRYILISYTENEYSAMSV